VKDLSFFERIREAKMGRGEEDGVDRRRRQRSLVNVFSEGTGNGKPNQQGRFRSRPARAKTCAQAQKWKTSRNHGPRHPETARRSQGRLC
jgi:hypothetical protein